MVKHNEAVGIMYNNFEVFKKTYDDLIQCYNSLYPTYMNRRTTKIYYSKKNIIHYKKVRILKNKIL